MICSHIGTVAIPEAGWTHLQVQALRSLETGLDGWSLPKNWKRMTAQQLEYGLRVPNPERMTVLKQVASLGAPGPRMAGVVPDHSSLNITPCPLAPESLPYHIGSGADPSLSQPAPHQRISCLCCLTVHHVL